MNRRGTVILNPGPDDGCAQCRPVLEARARETYEDWCWRTAAEKGLVDYETWCAAIGQVNEALGRLLVEQPSTELLEIALDIKREPEL